MQEESKYYLEAKDWESQGNFSQAEKKYLLALDESPRSLRILQALVNLFYQQEKWDDSISFLQRVINIYPSDEAYFKMGECHHRNGENRSAIFFLKKALELNPAYINALVLLSQMYRNSGNYYKMEVYLRYMIEADPRNHYALWELAQLYDKTFRYKESLHTVEKFLTYYPEEAAKGEVLQAELYIKMGKFASAKDILSESLESDTNIQKMIEKLKSVPERRKALETKVNEKRQEFKDLENNKKYNPELTFEISLLYLMLGNFSESAKFLVYSRKIQEEEKMNSGEIYFPEAKKPDVIHKFMEF